MATPLPLPDELHRETALADWLEMCALLADDGNAGHADLQRPLNRLGHESTDDLCTKTMTELHRRTRDAGPSYPFEFSGSLLRLRNDWRDYVPYIFCLLLSACDDDVKQVRRISHTKLFEWLCCDVARGYVGGEVLRFGAPREGMPAGFVAAIEELKRCVEEWDAPRLRTGQGRQDGGLDIVAWKPFLDRRMGKMILFGHCASGQNWEDKLGELIPERFCSTWLGGEKSPIVKTFFIPHRVDSARWDMLANSARLFFDRCRIAATLHNAVTKPATRAGCISWCERVFAKLGKAA